MAYVSLDQQTLLDDWPWSSFFWRTVRDDLAQVRAERFYKAGLSFRAGRTQRWCSLWPVPWGIFWLYVPEVCDEVIARVRHVNVDFDDETAGAAAINLYATTIRPGGGFATPPTNRSDWVSPQGAALTKTTTDATTTLTAPIIGRGSGWVGVLIWTWSEIRDTAEDSADVTGTNSLFGTLELDLAAPTTVVAERVVALLDAGSAGSKDATSVSPTTAHQALHIYDAGSTTEYFLAPPHGAITENTSAVEASVHTMGVIEVDGVSVAAKPSDEPGLPEQRVYEPGQPAGWRVHAPLAAAANRLVRTRVPTWSLHPYSWSSTADQQGLWGLRGDSLDAARVSGANGDTTDYVAIHRVLLDAAIADSDGYAAVCALFAIPWNNSGATPFSTMGASSIPIVLRLAAYSLGASPSLIVAGSEFEALLPIQDWTLPANWQPLEWFMRIYRQWDHCQWRGALAGRLSTHIDSTLSDDVSLYELDMPETSITYPCQLRLQMRLDVDRSIGLMNVGSGIASRIKLGVTG